MPHTPQCQAEAPEGYCIGGCTITPDDCPELAAVIAASIEETP